MAEFKRTILTDENKVLLERYIAENRASMLSDLSQLVESKKAFIREFPLDFLNPDSDDPYIDVRLCIDMVSESEFVYIFRTGSVDFDPYFSLWCGAATITLTTDAEEMLGRMIEDAMAVW